MKYIFLLMIFILQGITFTTNAQSDVYSTLDKLITQSHQRGLFNGNASVYYQGNPIFQKSIGYTNGAKNNDLSINSTFALGSISKEFSAVAIMMLYEKGLLDIEEPVSTYILGLPAWSEKIKVKHLLNYTSGLPRLNFRAIKIASDFDSQLQQINALKFTPGEGYLYSNHNVLLQVKLIESITKQSYSTFIENYFFKPLKMKNSSFYASNEFTVTAFNNDGVNDPNRALPIKLMVHSTTQDMHNWLLALHAGKVISSTSLAILFNAFDQSANAALGQGESIKNKIVKHRHQGSHFNFESQIYYNERLDLQVILLTNNKNFKLDKITKAIEFIIQKKPYNVPRKSIYLAIRKTSYDNVEQGIKLYFQLKHSQKKLYDFDNKNELIRVGYKLIAQKQYQSAIKIFKLATTEFPDHANAFDSLAEAYYANGNLKAALANYQTSIKLDSDNINAISKIAKIQTML